MDKYGFFKIVFQIGLIFISFATNFKIIVNLLAYGIDTVAH